MEKPMLKVKVKTKQSDPIFNAHRDPAPIVYFFAEIYVGDIFLTDSGMWCKEENDAINNARANLTNKLELERTNYHPSEHRHGLDGWGQKHIETDPERVASVRKIYDEMEMPES